MTFNSGPGPWLREGSRGEYAEPGSEPRSVTRTPLCDREVSGADQLGIPREPTWRGNSKELLAIGRNG